MTTVNKTVMVMTTIMMIAAMMMTMTEIMMILTMNSMNMIPDMVRAV